MDAIELNLLSGLQQKRAMQARAARFQNAATQSVLRSIPFGTNPVTAEIAPTSTNGHNPISSAIEESGGALVNRSPVTTTNNHYHIQAPANPPAAGPIIVEPQPQPAAPQPGSVGRRAPWLWLLLIPLLLGLGALAWYLWPKLSPTPANPYPGYTAEPTIKFSSPPP